MGIEAAAIRLDVVQADHWASAIATLEGRWGGIDLLVNNAGISPRGTAESTDEALWERTLGINLKGAWLGIKAALPSLRPRRGTIVNIGSTRATRPMPGLFSYVISKAGLWGLTQQVAVECLNEGVTCNMVAPGWVDTPNERMIQARYGRPDFPAGIRNLTTPEEIGAAVVLPGVATGPQDQRGHPLPRCRSPRRRRCRNGPPCPIAAAPVLRRPYRLDDRSCLTAGASRLTSQHPRSPGS